MIDFLVIQAARMIEQIMLKGQLSEGKQRQRYLDLFGPAFVASYRDLLSLRLWRARLVLWSLADRSWCGIRLTHFGGTFGMDGDWQQG